MNRPGLVALALCVLPVLSAQAIDRAQSGFLTDSQGRLGTCAPYRLQFTAPEGSTATIEVKWQSVVLTRSVAVSQSPGRVVLPVPVAKEVAVTVAIGDSSDTIQAVPPPRPVSASYGQPYLAVFARDPLYARAILPPEPGACAADYFDTADFFADWRMLDGYDAIVLFNPDEARLPDGAQRAIAEFCSLGGAAFVAGSFRFGEHAADMPAPGEPQAMTIRGTPVQRFEYGTGAIYRCEYEVLRDARSAMQVILGAVHDHFWAGATTAPAGPAPSHAPPLELPWLEPGPRAEGKPGPLFWVLAGALLAATALAPVLADRFSKRTWISSAAIAVFTSAVGALAMTQSSPLPIAEAWPVCAIGPRPNGPASCRSFVVADPAITTWRINLDDAGRRWLPRPAGQSKWIIDAPLAPPPQVAGKPAELVNGRVDGMNFRDFTISAREGELSYTPESAALADWWLESNAWRGRVAALAACRAQVQPAPPGTDLRSREGIAVTSRRVVGGR